MHESRIVRVFIASFVTTACVSAADQRPTTKRFSVIAAHGQVGNRADIGCHDAFDFPTNCRAAEVAADVTFAAFTVGANGAIVVTALFGEPPGVANADSLLGRQKSEWPQHSRFSHKPSYKDESQHFSSNKLATQCVPDGQHP